MARSTLQGVIDAVAWYHDFDFGNGLRATSSLDNVDEVRPVWRFIEQQLDAIDFRGKSVLEIGAWDGYWSFYAERRGAARVLATDDASQNWGSGAGISLAKALLQSSIEIRQDVSIYDLARLGETFDIILCLGVYYHLHDPLYAFAELRHRCHRESLVLLEGSLACTGFRDNQVRYYHSPWLELLASSSSLTALLKTAYLRVESEAWMQPALATLPGDELRVDRAFHVCVPFTGINDVFSYPPPFGLHAYDPRFSGGLRAELEVVDLPAAVAPGERFTATVRVRNTGGDAWTAAPAPADYASMFCREQSGTDVVDDAAPGVQEYRRYLDHHGLQNAVTLGVTLSAGAGGRMIQRDYGRGFLPAGVPAGRSVEVEVVMRAPRSPGLYALTFDVVGEYVAWFGWIGSRVAIEYLTVSGPGVPRDSRAPGALRAEFVTVERVADALVLSIRNGGDTAWLKGPLSRGGHVQVGVQRVDAAGRVLDRDWQRVDLPQTVMPGETVVVPIHLSEAAARPDTARFKIDLVAEGRRWFEDVGSTPLLVDAGGAA